MDACLLLISGNYPMKEMLEIEQGFLDCCVLPAALFSEAMWGRGRQLTVTSSLASLWSFHAGQVIVHPQRG